MNMLISVLNVFENDERVNRTVETLKDVFNITVIAETTGNSSISFSENYSVASFRTYRLSSIRILPLRFIYWQIIKKFLMFIYAFRLMRCKNYSVVYCNDLDSIQALFPLRLFYRFKIIYDSHELWTERTGARRTLIHRIFNFIDTLSERFLFQRANLVITASQGIADELCRRYGSRLNIQPIRNLDKERSPLSENDRLILREKLGIPSNAVLTVNWGMIIETRGIIELIKAFDHLPDNYRLLILGNCPDDNILNLIRNNPRVHYPGFIERLKLFDYTSLADIGIIPYKTDNFLNYYLTFPNKLSQFMNASLALISYDCLESRNILLNCNDIEILDEISPLSISASILRASSNLRERRLHSRECFLEYYSWSKDRQLLIDAVSLAVGRKL